MTNSGNVSALVAKAKQHDMKYDKAFIVSLVDLTRLESNDRVEQVQQLAQQANTPLGPVASICIYREYITEVKALINNEAVKIATVANFPTGLESIETVCGNIEAAIQDGADEIDVVTPYQYYLNETGYNPFEFLEQCREVCGNKTMKVILESGALKDIDLIAKASKDAIIAGADFLKTSTGKISQGASLEAAATMISTIQQMNADVGFKASGGIKTYQQACEYMALAELIMGKAWIKAQHFRFGASFLLKDMLKTSTTD